MTDAADRSLDELAARAATGGEGAFRALALALLPRVQRLAWQILADSQAAADCAQEFLIKLLRILPEYDRGRPFWPWAKRIAVRGAIDLARRERRWDHAPLHTVADPPARDGQRPDRAYESRNLADRLREAADRLPGNQRAIFVLRDLEDWSTTEIAEHLEMAESTVRVHLARARTRLRAALAEEGERR